MSEVVLLKLNAGGQRDRLAFTAEAWRLLLELGETFGWKAHGARYQRQSRQDSDAARHSYEPGASNDPKYVDAEDAHEWAVALRAAKDSTHLLRLLGHSPQDVPVQSGFPDGAHDGDAQFAAVLSEFIDYASTGGFAFARGKVEQGPQ
ncbi:MAG TPA: hypothetical protein VGN07_10015 [Steroidobacteraceae bacterium]|jgi:hypothetical protein